MPTASLMTYVMGLDAAKTRAATEAERTEMRRLLNEGMDAGLCGFSIQRLGKHSAQADFDGSPMVTDTMCDEDILNLAEVLRARDEGFIEITQATGHIKEDLAFVEKLAATAQRPILFQAITASTRNADIHRKSLNWLHKARAKGLPIFGQGGTVRSGFAFTLEHWNLYDMAPAMASYDNRIQRREDREDEGSRDPRGSSRANARWRRWIRTRRESAAGW